MKSDWEGDLANMELERHQHTAVQCLGNIGYIGKISINCEDNKTVLNIANDMSVNAARSELSKCFHEVGQFTAIFHKIL